MKVSREKKEYMEKPEVREPELFTSSGRRAEDEVRVIGRGGKVNYVV